MIKEITFKNAGNLRNIKNENPLRQTQRSPFSFYQTDFLPECAISA